MDWKRLVKTLEEFEYNTQWTTFEQVHSAEDCKYAKTTCLDPREGRFVTVSTNAICVSTFFSLLGLRVPKAQ